MLKQLRNREDFGQKNLLQKGFTLVELLVVIVILGILAAVVVFAVGGSTDKAKQSSCKAEASAAATAIESYRAKTGNYPAAWSDLAGNAAGDNQFLRSAPADLTLQANGQLGLKPDTTTPDYTNPCTTADIS